MIILTHNILLLPLVLLSWVISAYLGMLAVRFLIHNTVRASRFDDALRRLTDPIPLAVENKLRREAFTPPPRWVTWLVIVAVLCLIQRLILALLVAVH